jgi:xylan 1,4-beta-xylosidase
MKKNILACVGLLTIVSWCYGDSQSRSTAVPPNIIVFLADNMGMGDTSAYQDWCGNLDSAQLHTPAMDKLAQNGVRFTDAHSPSSRCTPTRYALMTGRYCWRTRLKQWVLFGVHCDPLIERERTTLPEFLKKSGYTTGMVGKWHLGLTYSAKNGKSSKGWDDADLTKPLLDGPLDHGFDYFHGFSRSHRSSGPDGNKKSIKGVVLNRPTQTRGPGWLHNRRIAGATGNGKLLDGSYVQSRIGNVLDEHAQIFLDYANAKKKPFFLYLASHSNHALYTPTDRIGKYPVRGASKNVDGSSTDNIRLDFVYENDVLVARLMDYLESTDDPRRPGKMLIENTLFIFTSDNGAEINDKQYTGPLRSNKGSVYEGGRRIPFLASWPLGGITGGRDCKRLLALTDMYATVADILGKPLPPMKGKSYGAEDSVSQLAAMRGGKWKPRIPIYPNDHLEASEKRAPERAWVAVRSNAAPIPGEWKLFLYHEFAWSGKPNPMELYNLSNDRKEENNVLDNPEYKPVVKFLLEQAKRSGGKNGSTRQPLPAGAAKFNTAKPMEISEQAAPAVAGCPLHIVIEVYGKHKVPDGVVLAHGDSEMGYALHFDHGVPMFDVRIGKKVTRVVWTEAVAGKVRVEARLDKDKVSLAVDDGKAVTQPSPGLFPEQPLGGLSVGLDEGNPAGDYKGPNPFNEMILSTRIEAGGEPAIIAPVMDRATIEAGLKAHDRALFIKDGWIRDPYIILGPDDYYYLTGTTPMPGEPREQSHPYNSGLGKESIVGWKAGVWRSKDLIDWESLNSPFTLEDGIWFQKNPGRFEALEQSQWRLWAPEVHWLGDRWALTHTSPTPVKGSNLALTSGREIKGPWTHPMGIDLGHKHDPSLFNDDGIWYLLWGNTELAPLNADFSDFTAKPVRIDPAGSRPGPNGKPIIRIGHEGATMRKIGDKYVHLGTAWSTDSMRKGSYNLYYCTADKITGPYGPRKFAGRFLGHGTPFQDKQGRWWCTAFYNANVPTVPRRGIETRDLGVTAQTINKRGTTIVPLEVKVQPDGDIYIRAKDPAYANPGPDEAHKFFNTLQRK